MADVSQMVSDGFSGDTQQAKQAQVDIAKAYERQMIRDFWAPIKQSELKKIKSSFKTEVKETATNTKSSLKGLSDQLDSELKGKFSKKVQSTVSEKNKLWDDLGK